MTYDLFQHQYEGVRFLIDNRYGILAFEQGLGKTIVAIDAFRSLRSSGEVDRILVLCPNSLKRNWASEFEKFAPELSWQIAEGTPKQRKGIFFRTEDPVVITSYETARSEVTAILSLIQKQRTVLVLDESHSAKNWSSLTSQAARHFAPHCPYRWLLSGTPITNTPEDLYTQVEIAAPGKRVLGTRETFLDSIASNPSGVSMRNAIDKIVLRRTKEQCLDLPEKLFSDIQVELPPWQRKLYDNMRDEMVCAIEVMSGDEFRAYAPTALSQLMRLIQLASNPALIFPQIRNMPAKFNVLEGLVDDILTVSGRKVIIWSNFVATIEYLLELFEPKGAAAIYGGTPVNERQLIAKRFQENEDKRILIANPAAAGTGFTLTAASYSIYETLSWRFDHFAQSQDRNHRIGQTSVVTYLRLIAADTIEEAVSAALDKKSRLAGALLGDPASQQAISDLSQEELCALIRTNKLPDQK